MRKVLTNKWVKVVMAVGAAASLSMAIGISSKADGEFATGPVTITSKGEGSYVSSHGNFEYDNDSDGTPEVALYAGDMNELAMAVNNHSEYMLSLKGYSDGILESQKALEGRTEALESCSSALGTNLAGVAGDLLSLKDSYEALEEAFRNGCSQIAGTLTEQGVTTAQNAGPSEISENIIALANDRYNQGYAVGLADGLAQSIGEGVSLVIKAHFCSAGDGDKIVSFGSFDEYRNYLSEHPAEATSASPGGCYFETQHQNSVITGYKKCGHFDCTSINGDIAYFKCSGCGAAATSVYTGGNGWGAGDHKIPIYGSTDAGYYDKACEYANGQILDVQISVQPGE